MTTKSFLHLRAAHCAKRLPQRYKSKTHAVVHRRGPLLIESKYLSAQVLVSLQEITLNRISLNKIEFNKTGG
jgi:hypothetical protein